VPLQFLPLLRQHGLGEREIHAMTVANPARLLNAETGEEKEPADALDGVRIRAARGPER
jgi:hypothetical protein